MTIVLGIIALCLVGCATPARQTEALLRAPPADLPTRAQVNQVPFVNQSARYCGPATLAMAMGWNGFPITQEQLAAITLTPGQKGTLPQDMIGATRRQGLMAVPIEGLESLLRELAAGQPVIIFENLAFSWLPQWHYAIVTGYDLERREVTLNSGPVEAKHWDMAHFERSWEYSNHWGLVVLKPTQLAPAGGELAHLSSAAAFEQLGQPGLAETAYRTILSRWPSSLGAYIGLGNLAYARGDRDAAIGYLRIAVREHPESAAARHNLGVAEATAQR